jgi:hypothetical protein
MSNKNENTAIDNAKSDAALAFAMKMAEQVAEQVPKGDREALEAYLTGVLVVFWGALWGSFGTEYARGFIESQLRGMESDVPHDTFTKPRIQ